MTTPRRSFFASIAALFVAPKILSSGGRPVSAMAFLAERPSASDMLYGASYIARPDIVDAQKRINRMIAQFEYDMAEAGAPTLLPYEPVEDYYPPPALDDKA